MKEHEYVESIDWPYEDMLDIIKQLGHDSIKIDHENITLRFNAEAIIDFKFSKYGGYGNTSFTFSKAILTDLETKHVTRCDVDDCNSVAAYKCTESFEDGKIPSKILYTMTDCYCEEHSKLDGDWSSSNYHWQEI